MNCFLPAKSRGKIKDCDWFNRNQMSAIVSRHNAQCFAFLIDGALSAVADWSAMRFKMIVAVHGLMMRWFDVDERVVRPLTAFAICSSEFFELLDSSNRRRKSTTWAFNSLICMEQFRSFCACRFWMPITLFNWLKKDNGKIISIIARSIFSFQIGLPFSLLL